MAAIWLWGDDGNDFVPYNEHHSSALEAAYEEKKLRMDARLTIGSHTYRVRHLSVVPGYIKNSFGTLGPAAQRGVWIQQRIGEASLWREVQRVGGADGSDGAGPSDEAATEAATEPGPSVSPSESGAQDELVGKEVVIQGIKKKRTDLNGKRARVEELGTGEHLGRYLVRIIEEGGGSKSKKLLLRPENLARVDFDEAEDGNVTDEYGGSGEDEEAAGEAEQPGADEPVAEESHAQNAAAQPRADKPTADEETHAQHAPMDEEDDDGTEEGDATDNDEPQDASGGGDPVPPPAAAATELEMAADERGASAAAELGEEASAEASDGYEAQLQRLLQERPPLMDKADVDWVFEKTPAECVDALENINEQIKVEEDPVDLARYRYFARVCEFRASRRESVVVD